MAGFDDENSALHLDDSFRLLENGLDLAGIPIPSLAEGLGKGGRSNRLQRHEPPLCFGEYLLGEHEDISLARRPVVGLEGVQGDSGEVVTDADLRNVGDGKNLQARNHGLRVSPLGGRS